jgi:hypothetical protein
MPLLLISALRFIVDFYGIIYVGKAIDSSQVGTIIISPIYCSYRNDPGNYVSVDRNYERPIIFVMGRTCLLMYMLYLYEYVLLLLYAAICCTSSISYF